MQATNFEFRQRFWIFGAVFALAFASYGVDQQNAGAWFVEWIGHLRGISASNRDYHLIFVVAALLVFAAALLRTWATAYLHAEVMVDQSLHTSRLLADGPYRFVRNPLYVGNILLALGFGVMASRIGFFVLVVGIFLFSYRLILREEAGMASVQGTSYREYCRRVPRMFPSLRPQVASAGSMPNWADGFLGEAFMWMLGIAVLSFAISLNQAIYFALVALAFVVHSICLAIIKRRHKGDDEAGRRKIPRNASS